MVLIPLSIWPTMVWAPVGESPVAARVLIPSAARATAKMVVRVPGNAEAGLGSEIHEEVAQ